MHDSGSSRGGTSVTIQSRRLGGPVTLLCAPDKSLTHRALLFAGVARGTSHVRDPLTGEDCRATAGCLEALGVTVEQDDDLWTVKSPGLAAWHSPTKPLDCMNSGTTARLITGLLASRPGLSAELIGDDSLSKRPMARVVEPLRQMGAIISGKDDGRLLPLRIEGARLRPAVLRATHASAQVKSAILLAAMGVEGQTTVTLPGGSRDHTEIMLRRFGAKLDVQKTPQEETIALDGPCAVESFDVRIPVDPSSAAFFCALGLMGTAGATISLPHVLNNDTRLGFLRVLQRMSAGLETIQEPTQDFVEPTMTVKVRGGMPLLATTVMAEEVPTLVDEVPILAVIAAFAEGLTTFHGVGELRVKESDRLAMTSELLRAAGVEVTIRGDDLIVQGGLKVARAFHFNPRGDHRLAMAAAVMARLADGASVIDEPECVAVSFPEFFNLLNHCG